jgi:hypothetical protein
LNGLMKDATSMYGYQIYPPEELSFVETESNMISMLS